MDYFKGVCEVVGNKFLEKATDVGMVVLELNNKWFLVEKCWNVIYIDEVDLYLINMFLKEIIGFIKILGGLNRIIEVLFYSFCWRWVSVFSFIFWLVKEEG